VAFLREHRRLVSCAIVVALLVGSLVFMAMAWNNGKYIRAYESMKYREVQKKDAELLVGDKYVVQPGQRGVRLNYYVMNSDGGKGKLLTSRVLRQPLERIVVTGSKPESAVKADAMGLITAYVEAMKVKDYKKLMDNSTPDTVKGASEATMRDAMAATGETVASYTIGSITLYRNDVWNKNQQQSSYGSSERTDLSKPDALGTAALVAVVDVDLMMSSPRYEQVLVKGKAYMLLSEKQWKVQYWGPTRKVDVAQTRTDRQTGWNGDYMMDVTLESVVLYPDRFALLAREANRSTGELASMSSDIDGMNVSLQNDESTTEVSDFSSTLKYSLDKGQSQSGMMTYEPAVGSGDVVYVKGSDFEFDPIKIP